MNNNPIDHENDPGLPPSPPADERPAIVEAAAARASLLPVPEGHSGGYAASDINGSIGGSMEGTASLGASDLWHGFRRRWLLGSTLGLVCAVVGAVCAWPFFEPDYVATGYLKLATRQSVLVQNQRSVSTSRTDYDLYKRTQKELILRHYLLDKVFDALNVQDLEIVRHQADPVEWLVERVTVAFPGNAELLTISVSASDPKAAAVLCNALIEVYVKDSETKAKDDRTLRLESITQARDIALNNAKAKELEVTARANALGTGDSQTLTLKQQVAVQAFAELGKELRRVQFDLNMAGVDLAVETSRIKPAEEFEIAPADLDRLVNEQPEVQLAQADIIKLDATLTKSSSVARPGSQKMLDQYRDKLDQARTNLDSLKAKYRAELKPQVQAQALAAVEGRVNELQSQIVTLERQKVELERLTSEQTEEAKSMGSSSMSLELAKNEMDYLNELVGRFSNEIESLRLEEELTPRVTLVNEANEPTVKDMRPAIQATGGIAALGFVFPLVGVVWLDARSRRVSSAAEVHRLLGMRVIGSLPMLPSPTRRMLGRTERRRPHWRISLRESIDGVRTMLMRQSDLGPTRVVLVTSAVGGEGKTTLATQLAISFARARCRTLLVDFDLRRPAAHKVFNVAVEPGVSEVLRGDSDLADIVQPTGVDNLWMIPAGVCDDEVLSALALNDVTRLFAALRSEFEFIIVDCAPVLPVVDALLIGRHVDSAVLSVLRDVSQGPKIQAACQRLSALGIRVLGTVMTGAEETSHRSEYRYQMQP